MLVAFNCASSGNAALCICFIMALSNPGMVLAQNATQNIELDQALRSNPKDLGRSNQRGKIVKQAISLVDTRGDGELRAMTHGSEISLALLAAWERVRRSEEDAKGRYLNWFRGYLEGKLDISIPDIWIEKITTGAKQQIDSLSASQERNDNCTGDKAESRVQAGALKIAVRKNQQVREDGQHLVFGEGKLECRVNSKAFATIGSGKIDGLSYHMDAEFLIVAMFEDTAGMYPIFCFSVHDGRQIWSQTAWANLASTNKSKGLTLTSSVHCLEIQRSGGRIFLFGSTYSNCYCEAYCIADGKCLLRFSTCQWFGQQLQ